MVYMHSCLRRATDINDEHSSQGEPKKKATGLSASRFCILAYLEILKLILGALGLKSLKP